MMRNCILNARSLCHDTISVAAFFLQSRRRNADACTWRKPAKGCVKLNFDGASKFATGNASIGGVYRNHEGAFLLGYAERIGKATSSVAEVIAAKRGLELALQNGWLNLWMEGDAKAVVDHLLHKGRLRSKEDLRHLREISMMVSQLDAFNASHIYRKGNKVAHKLAKMGYITSKPQIWQGVPPNEVLRLLRQDEMGD